MTVHVGEITSEVVAGGGAAATERENGEGALWAESQWDQRCRTEVVIERLARDRARTATGDGHD